MIEQQLAIEDTLLTEAKRRQQEDHRKTVQRGAWSESKAGRGFVSGGMNKFVPVIEDLINPERKGKAGRHALATKLLRDTGLDAETIAYLFTKGLFNVMALSHRRKVKRVTLSFACAEIIHDEWRIREFAKPDRRKNLLKRLIKTFDKRSYPRHWRRRTIINYFHAEECDWQGWTKAEKLAVGIALLTRFANHYLSNDGQRLLNVDEDSPYVEATEALVSEAQHVFERSVISYMIYAPMVVPPRPWAVEYLWRGGYISNSVRRYPFVKGYSKKDVERMSYADMSQIIPAINAIQETPWRINKRMLALLEWSYFDRRGGFAGLPPADPIPLPPEPLNYRTDEAVKKAHNHRCFLIHNENRENTGKRLLITSIIAVARQYKGFKDIYFPHNMDKRGRAYPVTAFLHPQTTDAGKSLLEFSRGKVIDNEEGVCWLAIAGANAFGQDKISLQERVDWVQDNEEMIFSIAEDPQSDLRWQDASEPFAFVRFCMEWKAFWDTGYGFVSHMVVPVDATCSGLQHYSAMLRDEVGGRSVNLVPGLPRQDIYQDVADRVIEKMMEAGDTFARDWVAFGISRKITKRQVMVVPYSGTFSSCMGYTRRAVDEKIAEGYPIAWSTADEQDHTARIVYLSKLIWEAIDEVVVKGKEAMQWLSKAGREYAKWANKNIEGNAYAKALRWTTPDGFEVVQYEPASKKNLLKTVLDGTHKKSKRQRTSLVYYTHNDGLDSQDMAQSIAPNFVHSLDATLLRMSVMNGLRLEPSPLKDFAMVHDSFGVHACDMPRFIKECVKPAFIKMYTEHDPLKDLSKALPTGLDLPALPSPGSLDLGGVMESDFFFS